MGSRAPGDFPVRDPRRPITANHPHVVLHGTLAHPPPHHLRHMTSACGAAALLTPRLAASLDTLPHVILTGASLRALVASLLQGCWCRPGAWSCPTDVEKGGSLVVGDFDIAAKYGE